MNSSISDKDLRDLSSMSLVSLYVDDITKLAVLKKLKALGLDTAKGTFSAAVRVLLRLLAEDVIPLSDELLIKLISEEYLYTTKKNKRSSL